MPLLAEEEASEADSSEENAEPAADGSAWGKAVERDDVSRASWEGRAVCRMGATCADVLERREL